jgi:putative uncharacterized protein (fragment)
MNAGDKLTYWVDGELVEHVVTQEEAEAWVKWEKENSTASIEQQTISFMRSMASSFTTLTDSVALSIPDLLPTWEELLDAGNPIQTGVCLMYNGQCYRQIQENAVTPQANQPPGGEGMLAVYRPINKEHLGTIDDPIPWVSGMDCKAGQYFSYNGKVYTVAEGGDMIPCIWPPDTSGLWQWVEVS